MKILHIIAPNTRKKQIIWLIVLAALVIAITILIIVYINKPKTETESPIVTYSTSEPNEEKPDNTYKWIGRPEDPKKITLQRLGIDAFVQNVGIDQRQEIAVPDNVHMAGWFADSARPGSAGLSIINGHVDGLRQREAVFSALPNVQNGDIVTVEFGDGSIASFKVFAMHEITTAESLSILFSQNPRVSSQLNLITCVGDYDEAAQTYDKRFVVYAERM